MRVAWLLLLVVSLVAFVGCKGSNPALVGRADSSALARVEFVDDGLREQTAIGGINVKRDASGLLQVDVLLCSTSRLQMMVDYRVRFFDPNGVPLDAPGEWMAVAIEPNVFRDIQVSSSSTRAGDFRMEVRYAR
jgi:uncharacterized protein YcfL